MIDNGSLLGMLRKVTAPLHKALEDQLGVIKRLSSDADRRRLVERYYRMHASADTALGPWLETIDGLDHLMRRRTPLLVEDLHALHLFVPEAAPIPKVEIADRFEALGFLYVLEGSTLGGRIIHKALSARGCSLTGVGFLDPYGSSTGERWRSFLAVLEREGASDPDGVERGGLKGFAHADACLLQPEAVP